MCLVCHVSAGTLWHQLFLLGLQGLIIGGNPNLNMLMIDQTEPYTTCLVWCRKPVWHQLSLLGLQELTNSCFTPIAPAAAAAALQQRPLGVARLRLLPKRAGLRPIAKLSSASVVRFRVQQQQQQQGRVIPAAAAAGRRTGADENSSSSMRGRGGSVRLGTTAAAAAAAAGGGGVRLAGRKRMRRTGGVATAAAAAAGVRRRGTAAAGRGVGGGSSSGSLLLSFKPVNVVLQSAFQVCA
jgi:hypothetical protein